MTTTKKQQLYVLGAVVLAVVLLLRYVWGFWSDPAILVYAINPISMVSYILEIPSIVMVASILWLLTLRSVATHQAAQAWNDAHYDNQVVAVPKEAPNVLLAPLQLALTNEQFITVLGGGALELPRATFASMPTEGRKLLLRHQDDYGQVVDGVVQQVNDTTATIKQV